jgi:hypothetical protein
MAPVISEEDIVIESDGTPVVEMVSMNSYQESGFTHKMNTNTYNYIKKPQNNNIDFSADLELHENYSPIDIK